MPREMRAVPILLNVIYKRIITFNAFNVDSVMRFYHLSYAVSELLMRYE